MVTAIVLVNTSKDGVNETAENLAELEGISHVYSVAGEYDLVAILKAKDDEAMAALVTEHILKLDAIVKTTTLMAFESYCKRDLESMFSVGFAEGNVGTDDTGFPQ